MGLKIKDIAAELKLSPATVSLAIRQKPGVSAATRQRVDKAFEKYREQENSPALRNEESKAIRLIIFRKKNGSGIYGQYFSSVFFSVLEGIELQAREMGHKLLVTYLNEEDVQSWTEIIPLTGIEGILLLGSDMEAQHMKILAQTGVPVVVIDNSYEMEDVDCVTVNNIQGASKAIHYLHSMGHRKIGYVHGLTESHNFFERCQGYLCAMQQCGMEVYSPHIFNVELCEDHMTEELVRLFTQCGTLPTAVFADNDILAMHTIKALEEMNLHVPQEISVVGFDDMPLASILQPALTTVGTAKGLMGSLAMQRLEELLRNRSSSPCKTEIFAGIVARESVKNLLET